MKDFEGGVCETKDVAPGAVYYGMPARPVKETLRSYALINRLSSMREEIARLKEAVAELASASEREKND